MRHPVLLAGAVVAGAIAMGAQKLSAQSVAEPAFTVVRREGAFELRAYDPMVVAAVETSGAHDEAINAGFRRLAGYIFGGNHRQQRIAMTAPVISAPAAGDRWSIRFVMPASFALETLPRPNDTGVQFEQRTRQLVVAVRFSGWAGERDRLHYEGQLRAWAERIGMRTQGAAVLAQYNPPWTLPFLRRNEVHLRVE